MHPLKSHTFARRTETGEWFPTQGSWSEEAYFNLPGNRVVEYSQGFIEVLPVPTLDPKKRRLTVLRLDGQKCVVHGEFGAAEHATSVLLDGFGVGADDMFAVKGAKS